MLVLTADNETRAEIMLLSQETYAVGSTMDIFLMPVDGQCCTTRPGHMMYLTDFQMLVPMIVSLLLVLMVVMMLLLAIWVCLGATISGWCNYWRLLRRRRRSANKKTDGEPLLASAPLP